MLWVKPEVRMILEDSVRRDIRPEDCATNLIHVLNMFGEAENILVHTLNGTTMNSTVNYSLVILSLKTMTNLP